MNMLNFLNTDSSRRFWVITIPIVIYLFGLNPHLTPQLYDNILYYLAGLEVSETWTYVQGGVYDFGWPPVIPFVLAAPFSLGFKSILAAKVIVIFFALVALILLHRLFRMEGRLFPNAVLFLFAISPQSLRVSSRILSEWPYTALSIGFLIMLHLLNKQHRTVAFALLTGAVLATTIMMRYIGLLLGVAVIVQLVQKIPMWKEWYRVKHYYHEMIVGFCGLAVYGMWKIYLYHVWTYSNVGLFNFDPSMERFTHFSLSGLFLMMSDALTYMHVVVSSPNSWLSLTLSFLIVAIILVGMGHLVKQRKLQPCDYYVFAVLCVLALFRFKLIRYMHPITPFLIYYFFIGAKALFTPLLKERFQTVAKYVFLVWVFLFLCLDGVLLTVGNRRLYNGISYLASPTPEIFYRGKWYDFYLASEYLRNSPRKGKVANTFLIPVDDKYLYWFSKRDVTKDSNEQDVAFLFVENDRKDFDQQIQSGEFKEVKRFGIYTIYEKVRGK